MASCAAVGGGVNIAVCTLDLPTYNGADITDQGTDPVNYIGQSYAIYPSGDPVLENMFLDLGGGSCTFPFKDLGYSAITGSLSIPIATRTTNLSVTSPIYMVRFNMLACSDAVNAIVAMQIGLGLLGVQVDGVTPSSYTTGGPIGITQFDAWFRLNPATGLPWEYDDLFGGSAVDFNLDISLGDFDVVAAWIDVFFGTGTVTPDIEYTGEGGVVIDTEVGGGLEVGGGATLVLSVDASGIYTLVEGQKFDIIYTRIATPSESEHVQIPDPYARTAYLGG